MFSTAFKLCEKAVHVIVLRSKDACPSVEGRMSFGRGTHVLRSGDACPSVGGRMSFGRGTHVLRSGGACPSVEGR